MLLSATLREFFSSEHAAVQAQVEGLIGSSTRTLELVAYVGNPPTQVHVAGYDDLTPGNPRPIEKTRFSFDERFQAEYSAAVELSRSASRLNGLKEQALSVLGRQLAVLKDAVDGLATHAQSLLAAANAAAPAGSALAADPAVISARDAATKCNAVSVALLPTVQAAVSPAPGVDPAQLLSATITALQTSKLQAEACLTAVTTAVSAWGALAAATKATLAALSPPLESLSKMVAIVSAGVAQSNAAAAPTLTTLAVRLSEARDTEIVLVNTSRAEGDLLTLRARVLDKDGKVVPGGETVRYLRVRARGFVADTGAAVLFARGINPDPGPLLPSAGAFAVLRYKGWRGANEANANFFHVLAPGLGLVAVGIPQTEDGSTKIAWMVTGHLFGDILQGGVGVSTNLKPYWAVGIGLHRIAGLGTYFP